ncbi:esterase [Enterococcus sp. JM4C]|nr:esterase [Enterococcus sp. JM4C]
MKKTLKLPNGSAIDYYQSDFPTSQPKNYIFYFHGGGLVYGTKSDLPTELTEVFLKNKYEVIVFDYLLAPNATLEEILQALFESIQYVQGKITKNRPYSFCGRSAGGFLMLQLLKQFPSLAPEFLVNFYGYTDLAFLNVERTLIPTEITEKDIQTIDTSPTAAVWDDPFLERFLLYHFAVQQQKLLDYYGLTTQTAEKYRLTQADLANFPICFSTASTTDKEIPFRYSKQLAKAIPGSQFVPLYYLDHDFLKQTDQPSVKELFTKLDTWLQGQSS